MHGTCILIREVFGASHLPINQGDDSDNAAARIDELIACLGRGTAGGDHVINHHDRRSGGRIVFYAGTGAMLFGFLADDGAGNSGATDLMGAHDNRGNDEIGPEGEAADGNRAFREDIDLFKEGIGDQAQPFTVQGRFFAIEIEGGRATSAERQILSGDQGIAINDFPKPDEFFLHMVLGSSEKFVCNQGLPSMVW